MWLASLLALRPALHSLARMPPHRWCSSDKTRQEDKKRDHTIVPICYSSNSDDKKEADKLTSILASLKKSEGERKKTSGTTRTGLDKEVHLHLPSGRRDLGTGQDGKKELDTQPVAGLKKRRKQRRNLGIMIYFKK